MTTSSTTLSVSTRGFNDVHDLTGRVEDFLKRSRITDGLLTVFVPGSTAGITTIEYEPGAVSDLRHAIDRLAPESLHYDHDARWADGNGFAHVRAALLGPSLTLPVIGGSLRRGTWQQIVLVDFDNRPRQREVIIHVLGG